MPGLATIPNARARFVGAEKHSPGIGIGRCCEGDAGTVAGCPPSAPAIVRALRR